MSSKLDQTNSNINRGSHEFSIDCCNHSISTSLRDLKDKYRDLCPEKLGSIESNKKLVKTDQCKN